MAEKKSNSVLADKLAGLKLDFSEYGQLPLRLDVQAMKAPEGKIIDAILAQYDKLHYIQNHLKKIDEYIKSGSKEPINEWNATHGKTLSTAVLSKLKGHNNETGGISAYFHDLQTIYDQEETIYDKMESQCIITDGTKAVTDAMRNERDEKRKTRSGKRRILVRDLKKDGKGFLFVAVEDTPSADENKEHKQEDKKEEVHSANGGDKVSDTIKEETLEIKKTTNKIGIYVAGFIITLTVVIAVASATGDKK